MSSVLYAYYVTLNLKSKSWRKARGIFGAREGPEKQCKTRSQIGYHDGISPPMSLWMSPQGMPWKPPKVKDNPWLTWVHVTHGITWALGPKKGAVGPCGLPLLAPSHIPRDSQPPTEHPPIPYIYICSNIFGPTEYSPLLFHLSFHTAKFVIYVGRVALWNRTHHRGAVDVGSKWLGSQCEVAHGNQAQGQRRCALAALVSYSYSVTSFVLCAYCIVFCLFATLCGVSASVVNQR